MCSKLVLCNVHFEHIVYAILITSYEIENFRGMDANFIRKLDRNENENKCCNGNRCYKLLFYNHQTVQ